MRHARERDHGYMPTDRIFSEHEGSLLAAREQTMFDAAHWRRRTDETRAYAEQMKDRDARARMLQVAKRYEMFATRADVLGTAGKSRGKSAHHLRGRRGPAPGGAFPHPD